MFDTIKRSPSASETCAEHIRALILENKLRPGDRLPPERHLAERLGVNRQTLRAALAQLRTDRLLVARQGSGHVVTAYEQVAGPALLPQLVKLMAPDQQLELCADLLLIRRHVAAAALTRLLEIDSFDPEPAARAILDFMLLVREGAGTAALAVADVAIVGAVLEATGSPAFRLVVNPIAQALEALPALRDAIYGEPELTAVVHDRLLAWLDAPSREGIAELLETLRERDVQTVERLAEGLAR
jgi:DNA-binding FadR family transcriptional regulator